MAKPHTFGSILKRTEKAIEEEEIDIFDGAELGNYKIISDDTTIPDNNNTVLYGPIQVEASLRIGDNTDVIVLNLSDANPVEIDFQEEFLGGDTVVSLDNSTRIIDRNDSTVSKSVRVTHDATLYDPVKVVTGSYMKVEDGASLTVRQFDEIVKILPPPEILIGGDSIINISGSLRFIDRNDSTVRGDTRIADHDIDAVLYSPVTINPGRYLKIDDGAELRVSTINEEDRVTTIQTSADSFADNNTSLMTSAAIDDRINTVVSGANTLAEMDDTNISSAAAGHILVYDNTASVWDNVALTPGDLIDVTSGDGTLEIDVDLAEASEASIADGDYMLFLDGGATGTTKKEAVHDIATLFAGTGLTATNSVLAVDAEQAISSVTGDLTVGGGDLIIKAANDVSASLLMQSDNSDDAGDDWKLTAGSTFTIGNDIQSAGTDVAHLTITPNATVAASTTAVAGVLKVGGNKIQASDGGDTITMDTSDNVTIAGHLTVAGGQIKNVAGNTALSLGHPDSYPDVTFAGALIVYNSGGSSLTIDGINGMVIGSRDDMVFQVDTDQASEAHTSTFQFKNGSGTEVVEINESGDLQIDGDLTIGGGDTTIGTAGNTTATTIGVITNTGTNAGKDLTISAGSTTTNGNNIDGGDLILKAGAGDGTGTSAMTFFTKVNGTDAAAERMRIHTDGNVGIGTTSPDTQLEISKDSANAVLTISAYHDTEATTPKITFRKADNTEASPALVDDNAVLGTLSFQGYDGSGFEEGAKIEAKVQGTPSDGSDMPVALTFWTTPDASATPVQRMTIDSTGGMDVINQNTFRRSSGRYYLEEFFSKRPQANGRIGNSWTGDDTTRACNQLFELQGTGFRNAGVDWGGNTAGLLLTTADYDATANAQQIVAPHEDQGADSQYDSAWRGVHWGTENQVEWETAIMTAGSIANHGFWAGLKQSNTSTIATDDDQAYFTYCAADTFGTLAVNANWHFVYSIAGTDYITNLGLAVQAETVYRLRINIDSSRQVSVFINDTQYGLTDSGGTTGTTESDSRKKSVALTNDENFIPYVGVQTLASGFAYMYLFYEKISRILSE